MKGLKKLVFVPLMATMLAGCGSPNVKVNLTSDPWKGGNFTQHMYLPEEGKGLYVVRVDISIMESAKDQMLTPDMFKVNDKGAYTFVTSFSYISWEVLKHTKEKEFKSSITDSTQDYYVAFDFDFTKDDKFTFKGTTLIDGDFVDMKL